MNFIEDEVRCQNRPGIKIAAAPPHTVGDIEVTTQELVNGAEDDVPFKAWIFWVLACLQCDEGLTLGRGAKALDEVLGAIAQTIGQSPQGHDIDEFLGEVEISLKREKKGRDRGFCFAGTRGSAKDDAGLGQEMLNGLVLERARVKAGQGLKTVMEVGHNRDSKA